MTILGFGGMFGAFTYIAYTLTEVSGFAAVHRAVAADALRRRPVHRQLARRQAADRDVDRTLLVVLAVLVVVLVVFALTARQPGR